MEIALRTNLFQSLGISVKRSATSFTVCELIHRKNETFFEKKEKNFSFSVQIEIINFSYFFNHNLTSHSKRAKI